MEQTESISIRPMQPQDLEQVLAIDKASFSMPWPASAYNYELKENPLSLLWVAVSKLPGGEEPVVGMIVIWLIVDEAHIATLAVRPDYRSRGIAGALLATALRMALRQGYHKATLEVRANNIAAQRLYHRFGFEIVGHRPRYYRDNNEDAIIMTASELNLANLEDGSEEKQFPG
jgi:ribosomal-protein-alanine N-acetyltransferase